MSDFSPEQRPNQQDFEDPNRLDSKGRPRNWIESPNYTGWDRRDRLTLSEKVCIGAISVVGLATVLYIGDRNHPTPPPAEQTTITIPPPTMPPNTIMGELS